MSGWRDQHEPRAGHQIEVGVVVEGVVIARNWAQGPSPSTIATGTVPYADYPRTVLCYLSAPFASDEATGTILPQCGDERTDIIEEYSTHNVNLTPSCSDFTSSGGSANFTWSELNGGWTNGNPHEPWGMINSGLTTGLEQTRTNYDRGGIRLSSGYRCPHGNAAVGGVAQSRHMHGRAADMYSADHPWTEDEFDLLRAAAEDTGNTIELLFWTSYPDHHLHAAW